MYVWLDSNGKLNVALSQSLAPSNAIFIDTSAYNSVPPVDALVSISNGQIVVNSTSQVLQNLKQLALQQLSQSTMSYIYQYYPDWKQRSDMSDLTNGEAYLTYAGLNPTQVRQTITQQVLSGASYTQALSTLSQTFNSNTNPTIGYWLEQLLNVGYRQDFVFKVKQQYYSISQQLSSATALPLPSYTISVPPPNIP